MVRRDGLLLLLAAGALGSFAPLASASPGPQLAVEIAADEQAEATDEAQPATDPPRPLPYPQVYGRYIDRVERLRVRIHALRARIAVIRSTYSHSTTIYRVHRPKKHERIKHCREIIKELREKALAKAA